MFEKHDLGLNDEVISKRMDELSKHYPEASNETLLTHDTFAFENNISIVKFVKSDKLTLDEKREFALKLNEEWLETVVRPYLTSLCDFCEKYEMVVMKTKINAKAQPMMRMLLEEMGGSVLSDKLDQLFNNED